MELGGWCTATSCGVCKGCGGTHPSLVRNRIAWRSSGLNRCETRRWCSLLDISPGHDPQQTGVLAVCGIVVALAINALWHLLWRFGAFTRAMNLDILDAAVGYVELVIEFHTLEATNCILNGSNMFVTFFGESKVKIRPASSSIGPLLFLPV